MYWSWIFSLAFAAVVHASSRVSVCAASRGATESWQADVTTAANINAVVGITRDRAPHPWASGCKILLSYACRLVATPRPESPQASYLSVFHFPAVAIHRGTRPDENDATN